MAFVFLLILVFFTDHYCGGGGGGGGRVSDKHCLLSLFSFYFCYTIMILNFQTDRSWQIVQTQIRQLLEGQSDRVSTASFGSFMIKQPCSDFRRISAIFCVPEFLGFLLYLSVQILG